MRAQRRSRRDVTDCWRRHWPKEYDKGIRFQKAQMNDLNGGSVMCCITVCSICGADVDSCEDRDRR